jgi:quercetin dioxygenase-like cupin family protein
MKRTLLAVGVVSAVGIVLGLLGEPLGAQDPLAAGTVLGRTAIAGSDGMEAILVLRELPPGGESGRHTQSYGELVYILEGAVVLEVDGREAVTVQAGGTFQTAAGEVHNVKNASATAGGKALAFYIARAGASIEELSLPAE